MEKDLTEKDNSNYWINELSDLEEETVQWDYHKDGYKKAKYSIDIDGEMARKLNVICKGNMFLMYSFIVSAMKINLAKYTGKKSVTLGIPHYNLKKSKKVVYNKILPLTSQINHDKTYKEYMVTTKDKILEIYVNQDYLKKNILLEIAQCSDVRELTPVSIGMTNIHDEKHINYIVDSDKNNISFIFESSKENCLKLDAIYNANKFAESTINNMCKTFTKVINTVLSDYNKKIKDIVILDEDDRNKILYGFNKTSKNYEQNKTIQEIFQEQVEKTPDNIAVVFDVEKITYEELNRKSNNLAVILRSKGVRTDSIVGLMVDRSIEMIVGIMAILKAGGAYLPIDTSCPKDRIEYMLKDSGTNILLSKSNLVDSITFEGIAIDLFKDSSSLSEDNSTNLSIINNCNDLAYVMYTSGTTGNPKGVMIEHRSINNLMLALDENIYKKYNEYLNVCLVAPYYFDASVQQIFAAILNGHSLYITDDYTRRDAEKLIKYYKHNNIHISDGTPMHIKILLNCEENKVQSTKIKEYIIGGEELNLNSVKDLYQAFGQKIKPYINNVYGPAECCVDSSIYKINSDKINDLEFIPIGKPMTNYNLYILSEYNEVMPIGVQGELCISGDGVGRGYLNNPKLTSEKFVDNPFELGTKMYKTGDLARWLPDGNIEFLGRIDNQVKIRGFRIELGEIENKVLENKDVKEATAIVIDDKNGDKHICLYIVSEKSISNLNLREYLKESLPEYMVPSYFVKLDKMPITSNGKRDRKALPKPKLDESLTNYEAPRNELEKNLAQIWSEVLGINKIGIDDNFFELGGHSLKAMTLISKIHKKTNKEVSLKELFNSPTIKGISKVIQDAEENIYFQIEKIQDREYYEASSAQKRMYVIQGFDKKSVAYNMPQIFKLQGIIDQEKIESVLKELVKRHEALRTYFEAVDDKIVQKIDNKYEFKLDILKGQTFSALTNSKNHIEQIAKDFVQPFDLGKAPLFRAELVEIQGRSYLLIDMHHIVSDGVSMSILINEFTTLHNGGKLEPLKLQYRDFSTWQNKYLQSEEIKDQEQYWINKFNNEIPVLNMPTDYERPAIKSFEGDNVSFEIESSTLNKLKELTNKTGTTMHMVLLSAFNILLSKYSGQEDIVIGTPIAGRPYVDLQNIMGMFVNTLALRNRPEEDKKYLDFLNEVKENSLKAYHNQSYQLDILIERLNIVRDTSRNPLFDVMFNMLDTVTDVNIKLNNMELTPYMSENTVAKFDLTLNALEQENKIIISIDYYTKLFNKSSVERLGKHYLSILKNIATNTEMKLGQIDLLSDEEKNLILHNFNNTKIEYPRNKTIQELFEIQAEKTPDNIAVVFEDNKLTYKELNEKANSLAKLLRNKGVKADFIVGIMIDRSLEMIIGIIGILKAGGAYLPIEPDHPKQRIEYMLKDSQSQILLTTESQVKEIGFGGEIIDLYKESFSDSLKNLPQINSSHNLAYVIYTSGTTGNPKGTMLKHSNLNNFIMSLNKSFKDLIGYKDKVLSLTNYIFDVSVCEIFSALTNGATLVINDKHKTFDPNEISRLIMKNKITFTYIPPLLLTSVYEKLKISSAKSEIKLNKLLVGVEAIRGKTLNNFYELNKSMEIINGYGPTETTICSTFYNVNQGEIEDKSVPIGKPLGNTKIYIVNNNKLQPIGVPGELCVSGDGVGRGYLNNPKLTSEKFVDNPFELGTKMYKTGDLARWLPDGNIEFLGRIDNQVKVRGFRIELGEIENAILKCGIKETVVIVKERKVGEKYLVAFVKCEGTNITNIRKSLKDTLPNYRVPDFIVEIEEMPMTSSGKVDRKALQQLEEYYIKCEGYVEPRTETEKVLAKIWGKLLNLDSVSLNDSFFEVGGNSLLIINMLDKLQNEIKVSLEIGDLYKYPVLQELSEIIDKKKLTSEKVKEGIILLRKGSKKRSKKLILIHGGSGSIGGYANLFREEKFSIDKDYDVYAIKFSKLKSCAPMEISINDLADDYADIVEKYFKDESIVLGGWCIGSLIATEIAKILEKRKISVQKLLIFNAIAPRKWEDKISFNMESEIEYLKGIVDADLLNKVSGEARDVEEVWQNILPYVIENTDILNKVPEEILHSIPNYKTLTVQDIIYYLVCMRVLHRARLYYVPREKVKVKVYYFNPTRDITIDNKENNINIWQKYFENNIQVLNVDGDEHTIFDEDIKHMINKINQVLLQGL
ncbi:hypothetical protein AN1V17_02370 [Vallitalea sediminicola]